MNYRSLGRTGVQVSELCLGTMMFGGKTDESDSIPIIDRAIDAGINFIDTANVYSRGRSEEVVGKALKGNGKRANIVLATKVHGQMDPDDPNGRGVSRRHIMAQCEASLKRLQTDYIDLYQMHRPMSSIPIDESLRALDDLVRSGKVRYIGTSNFAAWQMVESLWASKELGLNRFVCTQPPYNMMDRRVERELVPMALTYGLAIIPWSPLAGGFLTGKYRRGAEKPKGARHEQRTPDTTGALFSDRAYDVIETVAKIAGEKGCSPSQFALAWCKEQRGITCPIIGPRTMEQLVDNLGALEVTVTKEDMARIDEVTAPGRAVSPYYQPDVINTDFGPHPYRL
ncbi:MAG: aldo/keto reductase [Spirochaetales bacterium]|nr:aldo/keto reductase [Spirochaetales bacterium]